nr:homogentisate 1,2-dioxygenase [Legionellales bacterium]
YPTAHFFEQNDTFVWYQKFQGHWWQTHLTYHPCNVVAWRGNYAPYQYDLRLFNTLNSVSFDHPDPSIFTVLTSTSDTSGVANVDLAIFPPRWQVAEHTFRPPYFHRNVMSEFMGLIHGVYEAKQQGFTAGGCSLHNCFIPHGPDAQTYRQASQATLTPTQIKHTLAFILESRYAWQVTNTMYTKRQMDYLACWQGLA